MGNEYGPEIRSFKRLTSGLCDMTSDLWPSLLQPEACRR